MHGDCVASLAFAGAGVGGEVFGFDFRGGSEGEGGQEGEEEETHCYCLGENRDMGGGLEGGKCSGRKG